jgi:hypothetical protein
MTNYSIVRMGEDYIVCADDKSILKVASRRRAAQLVTNAVELLNLQSKLEADAEASLEETPEVS